MGYNFNDLKVKVLPNEVGVEIGIKNFPNCPMKYGLEKRDKTIGKTMYLVRWEGRVFNVSKKPSIYNNMAHYIDHGNGLGIDSNDLDD